jgi:hypothetical protein
MDDCKDTLTFDTEITKSDYFALTSILSLVTKDNYEEAKSKWGASVPDYFSLDFDSFSRKRERLTQMFSLANITVTSSEHFRRALSPDAAKNYASCMAEKANKPIVAWVESYDEATILVATMNRMADTTVQCQAVGNPKPTNEPSKLTTNAKEILEFPWVPRSGATITLNVKNVTTGNVLDGVVLKLAPIRKLEKRTETRELLGTITCGAGGHGSTTANQIYGNVSFVADPSFAIDPDTVREISSTGGGLIRKDIQWIAKIVDGRVVRLDSSIKGAEADNGNTQRIMTFTFSVQQSRDYLVEIIE